MQLVTASVAGLAYIKAGKGSEPTYQQILDQWTDETEEWVPSICEQCPGGCGVLARVVDGKVVKIEGNPMHPINRGTLCMKGYAGLQFLYHPERIKGPMKRAGEKGEGKWQPITWDEAIQMVAGELNKLRKEKKSHTVAVLGGEYRGYRHLLWQRFTQAYGTPNYIRLLDPGMEEPSLAHRLMQGVTKPLGYDLFNVSLILSFGCDWLETWGSPVHQFRAYGHLREGAKGQKPKMFYIDSRYSISASKSDQWISINPGKEATLALGLAHVIIREGLYDKDFVRKHCFGFEDWQDESGKRRGGYKSIVLKDYEPLKVARVTGVPPKVIFGLARELAKTKPAIVLGEKQTSYGKGDLYTRMAIHSLNALTGNIGNSGALTIQGGVPIKEPKPFPVESTSRKALSKPRIDGAGEGAFFLTKDSPFNMPLNISRQEPYPLNLLFLYHANPVYHAPDGEAFAKALVKVPMVVSFSSFMDESTRYADLILPDQHYLERWQDDTVTHLSGFGLFSLGRPAIKPVVSSRNAMEVLLDIARKLDGGIASAFPWNKYEELLRESASGLLDAGRGYIVSTPHEEAFRKVLERQGYRIPEYKTNDDFWEGLLAAGAWWDPSDSYRGARDLLAGPHKTFDFYSRNLKKRFEDEARRISEMTGVTISEAQENLIKIMKLKGKGDSLFIPHQEPEDGGSSEKYPFYLNTYKLHSLTNGAGANQPWLQESMAIHLDEKWHNWAEINPQTAQQLGIHDGDLILLESPRGTIKLKAKLYEGALPQVVNVPLGEGHTDYGRWADDNAEYPIALRKGYAVGHINYKHWIQERGPNPNQIVNETIDPFTGLALVNQTRVKIRKA